MRVHSCIRYKKLKCSGVLILIRLCLLWKHVHLITVSFASSTPVCLIIIPVCLFILDKRAGGYSYYFENILTITLFLINEIQIFFLLCTVLNKSFNLIIILLFYDNWFNF